MMIRHDETTNSDCVWDPQMTLLRPLLGNVKDYYRRYRECCRHYGYKVRVNGGWKFFEFEDDYLNWRRQR